MRWSLARMFYLVTAVAIVLGVYSQQWRINNSNYHSTAALGGYIALLTAATMVGLKSSSPTWKQFWASYSLFGWSYFFFVLRGGYVIILTFIEWGFAFAFASAFAAIALTGPVETKKDDDSETPKT